MSTAQQTRETHRSADPAAVFDEHIFYNREVCSQCFARIREHDNYRPDTDGGVSKHAPTDRWRRAHEGVPGEAIVKEVDEYGYRPIYDDRTFCGHCGSESGHADISEALPRETAVDYSHRLVDRLWEYGFEVDRARVVSAVDYYKEQNYATNFDVDIFRLATTMAVRQLKYG